MWLRRIAGALFLVLLICGIGRAEVTATYTGQMHVSPDQVTVSWAQPDDDRVTHFEVRVVWLDQMPPMEIGFGTTTDTQMEIIRPRTGHFKVQVRSLSADQQSVWADSLDPDCTNGDPWWLYFKTPAVGGIEIE